MTQAAPGPVPKAKIVALIPAYQEADHIAAVVRRVRAQLNSVLVVDDGSSDCTTENAVEAGAEVITHLRNSGKGAALKTGLKILLERGFEYVVMLDGDGQHVPEEIDRFLSVAAETSAGIIIGNRMMDTRRMPLLRRLTNRFMSSQISRLCGQSIPDTQCGFRMVRRDVIPSLFCESDSYDYETEMLLIASWAGHRVVSVPVSTIYASEKSKIRPFRDGIRFVKLLLKYKAESASWVQRADNSPV